VHPLAASVILVGRRQAAFGERAQPVVQADRRRVCQREARLRSEEGSRPVAVNFSLGTHSGPTRMHTGLVSPRYAR